jgi:MYXO-CTERM domain-containing protein
VTIDAAAATLAEQGAIFSINHPTLDLGDACIGCAWKHALDGSKIGAIEIATAGSSSLFLQSSLDLWESYAASGHRLTPIGGSDDHQAGTDVGAFGAPIGSPCTMVFASELSVTGILEGVRTGRAVVKVRGPGDPMIELESGPGGENGVLVSATITGGSGLVARWVSNGVSSADIPIEGDPFELALDVAAPTGAVADRHRLEIWEGTQGVSFSSHVWVEPGSGELPEAGRVRLEGGNGCSAGGSPTSGLAALAVLAVLAGSRRLRKR